jgi:hypothetical protein
VAGTTRWVEPLAGPYVVQDDSRGTLPAHGEPYAAIGPDVAAVGAGTTVQAFDSRTGAPRWTTPLGGPASGRPGDQPAATQPAATQPAATQPAGEQIVSVRSWPGVVTVGVSTAGGPGSAQQPPGQQPPGQQREVVLDAGTGREIRAYPSAAFGGTVAADSRHTVVVQPGAVTSYRNDSGAAAWSAPTGGAPQAWRLDGNDVYVAVGSGGNLAGLGQQPAAALRRIDLRTGAERTVRAQRGSFAGSLSAALDGVVLFTGSGGVTAYSGATGRRLWSRDLQDVPQGVDLVTGRFYLSEQGGLAAVDTRSGRVQAWLPGSDGLYGERDGVVFGMDEGADGSGWGVGTASQRVVWTVSSLPWPHYFVDLSGVGGSADPRSDALILATCGQVNPGTVTQACAKPELVVINR